MPLDLEEGGGGVLETSALAVAPVRSRTEMEAVGNWTLGAASSQRVEGNTLAPVTARTRSDGQKIAEFTRIFRSLDLDGSGVSLGFQSASCRWHAEKFHVRISSWQAFWTSTSYEKPQTS